jgi:hypothetical protein
VDGSLREKCRFLVMTLKKSLQYQCVKGWAGYALGVCWAHHRPVPVSYLAALFYCLIDRQAIVTSQAELCCMFAQPFVQSLS